MDRMNRCSHSPQVLSSPDLDMSLLWSATSCQFTFFDDPAKVTPRVTGVTFFTCTLVSCVTVSSLHPRTDPQGH